MGGGGGGGGAGTVSYSVIDCCRTTLGWSCCCLPTAPSPRHTCTSWRPLTPQRPASKRPGASTLKGEGTDIGREGALPRSSFWPTPILQVLIQISDLSPSPVQRRVR